MGLVRYLKNWFSLFLQDPANYLHKVRIGQHFYARWKYSLSNGNPLEDRVPWITFEALDFLEALLTSEMIVFEYGSGGSTLFYSGKVKQVISIEHDPNWFEAIQNILVAGRIHNCNCLLIPPEATVIADNNPADPKSYSSGTKEFQGYNFREYVASIDTFPDQFFDFIAIDGRARPSCLWHAHRKVKVGGYLLLDDSERPYYQKAKNYLSDWEKHDFYGPAPYLSFFFQTTIWRRVH